MLKKLLGAAVVGSAMLATTVMVSAETIAEYDFGKEVLRIQGENFTSCEYPDNETFAVKSISESPNTWDEGKALSVTCGYNTLPEEDEDGKISYTYKIDVPETANYNIMLQASGGKAGSITDTNYVSLWDMEIDGSPATAESTSNRAVDITSIWYHAAKLTEGEHTLKINIPKAAKCGDSSIKDRFYFRLDYITLHNYYNIDTDFPITQMLDASSNNSAYGSGNEILRYVDKTDKTARSKRYAKFNITAPETGYYVLDFESQLETSGSISGFDIYVNDNKIESSKLNKLMYGSSPNPVANSVRQFERKYQSVIYLNQGSNEVKFVALSHARDNQWLILDHLTVSTLPAPTADKIRVEGEHAYNAADVFNSLSNDAAKLFGYNEFSNGIALQTYGKSADDKDVVLKYRVDAPETGAYNMGMMCSLYGSSFDIKINDVLLENVKSGSTRTENAIAAANSKVASDMYIYSYNNRVYLNKGINEVEVIVKPRSEDGQYIVDLDYLDFNLKETGAADPELSIDKIIYNGVDPAPRIGSNTIDVTVKNISAMAAADTIVIAAVYNGDTFKAAYVDELGTVAVNGTGTASLSGVDYTEGDTVKIFAWQKDSLTPFVNASIYTPAQ